MINRNSPIPLYYQLKHHFKQLIESGEMHAGDRLPTEMELCDKFSISRAPVRQALTELAQEGLIYRRPGQGSFVAPLAKSSLDSVTKIKVLAHYDVRWMTSLEHAVLRWNTNNPGDEMQLDVQMCSRDEYHKVLRRLVIRGEAPDIAPMDYVWITYYATDGYITPLNDLDNAWVGQMVRDLEPPVAQNNMVNGKLYGVPVQADITGLWYRRDWFEQECLQVPTTWQSWLDVIDHFGAPDVMERLGHRYSLVMPVTSATGEATVNLLIAFFWMAGGSIVDKAGNLTLNSPANLEALRFLRSISHDRRHLMPEDVYRSRWWDMVRFFAHGIVPMAMGGSYEWPRIREESEWDDEQITADKLGFVMLPRPSELVRPVGSLGGTSWAVFSQSRVKEQCLEILRNVSVQDVSAEFCESNLQISPYISVNHSFAGPEHPWLSSIVRYLAYARPRPMVPSYIRVSRFMQDMLEQVLWDGVSAEVALQQTAQTLSLVLAEGLA